MVAARSSGCTKSIYGRRMSSLTGKPRDRDQAGFRFLKYPSYPATQSMSIDRSKKFLCRSSATITTDRLGSGQLICNALCRLLRRGFVGAAVIVAVRRPLLVPNLKTCVRKSNSSRAGGPGGSRTHKAFAAVLQPSCADLSAMGRSSPPGCAAVVVFFAVIRHRFGGDGWESNPPRTPSRVCALPALSSCATGWWENHNTLPAHAPSGGRLKPSRQPHQRSRSSLTLQHPGLIPHLPHPPDLLPREL